MTPAPARPVYPPVHLLASILLMIGLHLLVPVRQVLSSPYRYLGAIPVVAGFAVVLWAARIFERSAATIKPFETSSTLVVRGPYLVSRNPIYLSMGLLGVATLAGSITPFLVVPAELETPAWRKILKWGLVFGMTLGVVPPSWDRSAARHAAAEVRLPARLDLVGVTEG